MSIPPYEPPKSPPPAGVGNTLLCPKCAGIMKTYERNGIHLEQCDTCKGIFLDFGELESHDPDGEPVRPGRAAATAPDAARATATTTARLGTPRQQALPQAGLRQAVLLQLAHPRRTRATSSLVVGVIGGGLHDGRPRERLQHRPRVPGRQRGSVGVPVRVDETPSSRRRGSARPPRTRRVGRGPTPDRRRRGRRRRSAATARSPTACRAGRDASRRARASTADRPSRPARPRRATRRRRGARRRGHARCRRHAAAAAATRAPASVRRPWLGCSRASNRPASAHGSAIRLWHNGFHSRPAGAPPRADRLRNGVERRKERTRLRRDAEPGSQCPRVGTRPVQSCTTTSPLTTISAPDRVCTPRVSAPRHSRCGRSR